MSIINTTILSPFSHSNPKASLYSETADGVSSGDATFEFDFETCDCDVCLCEVSLGKNLLFPVQLIGSALWSQFFTWNKYRRKTYGTSFASIGHLTFVFAVLKKYKVLKVIE